MKDKRELLKTGVFGVMDNGDKFVVINGYIVYLDGGFDVVKSCDEDLNYSNYKIEKLVECHSFRQLQGAIDGGNYNIIYDRKTKNASVEMTIAEIEAKLGIKNLKIVKEGK